MGAASGKRLTTTRISDEVERVHGPGGLMLRSHHVPLLTPLMARGVPCAAQRRGTCGTLWLRRHPGQRGADSAPCLCWLEVAKVASR